GWLPPPPAAGAGARPPAGGRGELSQEVLREGGRVGDPDLLGRRAVARPEEGPEGQVPDGEARAVVVFASRASFASGGAARRAPSPASGGRPRRQHAPPRPSRPPRR